ncbi:MAG: PadR family transcriptional regulator [Candidatus Thorarchaeota archaeon]
MTDTDNDELCCPPGCCDMRGMLAFQILWELRNGPLNGQQIANLIAQRRGTKPTPGTIYPALDKLKKDGLLNPAKDGRQVIYSLTESGIKGLEDAARYFNQAFGDIADECKVLVVKIGDDCKSC